MIGNFISLFYAESIQASFNDLKAKKERGKRIKEIERKLTGKLSSSDKLDKD